MEGGGQQGAATGLVSDRTVGATPAPGPGAVGVAFLHCTCDKHKKSRDAADLALVLGWLVFCVTGSTVTDLALRSGRLPWAMARAPGTKTAPCLWVSLRGGCRSTSMAKQDPRREAPCWAAKMSYSHRVRSVALARPPRLTQQLGAWAGCWIPAPVAS